jgi:sulfonate transport system ATP-binding protein
MARKVPDQMSATVADARTYPSPLGPFAVEVRGVRKSFGERAVLAGLDITVARGEFVAMLGASGSGKTTFLRILSDLDSADDGIVRVPKARSVVFQEPRLIPSRRVWRNVVIGRARRDATRSKAIAALDEVGLRDHAGAWPRTLSGGEAQRVALARALVREPGLLLLDEPFAALDALTRLRMHELVAALWQLHNPAVLLVTHDVDEAVLLADRAVVLKDGVIILDRPVDIARPRSRTDPRFGELRTQLLAALGVADSDAGAHLNTGGSPTATSS